MHRTVRVTLYKPYHTLHGYASTVCIILSLRILSQCANTEDCPRIVRVHYLIQLDCNLIKERLFYSVLYIAMSMVVVVSSC